MAQRNFDRRLGADFIDRVPKEPGVYFIYDEKDELIYVGKAKNLRRRLSQYRNAKRRKKHLKMRVIVKEAARINWQVCTSDRDACFEEMRLIQELRPKWNVAGAFYFLYPMVGIAREGDQLRFCYTTQPQDYPGFALHGAYRSRRTTKQAFFALMDLMSYLGHPVEWKKLRGVARDRYTRVFAFRRVDPRWDGALSAFLEGRSAGLLEDLALALLESADARKRSAEIQEALLEIRRFWRLEAQLLGRVRAAISHPEYPVSQRDRDWLFLKMRLA